MECSPLAFAATKEKVGPAVVWTTKPHHIFFPLQGLPLRQPFTARGRRVQAESFRLILLDIVMLSDFRLRSGVQPNSIFSLYSRDPLRVQRSSSWLKILKKINAYSFFIYEE